MKKIALVLVLFLTSLFNTVAYASEDTINVGIYPNEPLLFEDENGEAAGVFVDLLNEFASKEGFTIHYSFADLATNFQALENGSIDWIPGIAYSTERDDKYYFNEEVLFINWGQIYGTSDTTVSSMEDLINKTIGVQKSDIHYSGTYGIKNTLDQFRFPVKYIEFDSKNEIFEALSNNTIDVGVVNRIFGMINETSYSVAKTPIQLNPIRMHLISFDEEYASLFSRFDDYIYELKDNPDSIYYSSIEKWFGYNLTSKIPERLIQLFIGFAIIIALLLVNTVYTRYLVKVKTREINELNQNLEKKVIERTQLIKQQQEELIETSKMAALGQLVAGVAHEINTPIGVAVTVSSHMNDATLQTKSKLEENKLSKNGFIEYMNEMVKGSNMLLNSLRVAGNLIENYKQIAVDSHDITFDTINLKAYTMMVIDSLKTQTKKKNIEFRIFCEDDLEIVTYCGSYSQVINNLVMNSILHGFDNVNDGIISLDFKKTENGVNLIYQDNGVGIQEDVKKKIFEPFFTTKRGQGGSGLGMHIVYNVMTNKLNGHIKNHAGIEGGAGFDLFFRNIEGV